MTLADAILQAFGWLFLIYIFLGLGATLWDNIASKRQERKEAERG